MAIQMVVTGKGIIDLASLENAIATATASNPSLKANIVGGNVEFNSQPKVLYHSQDLTPDFQNSLFHESLRQHGCEFHLFNQSSLLFRVRHAIMDGMGATIALQQVFKALRGEKVQKILDHPTENEFLKDQTRKKAKIRKFPRIWRGFAKTASKNTGEIQFHLLSLPSKLENPLAILAQWYTSFIQSPARFLIPVNIRRYNPGFQACSNLSLPLFLDCEADSTSEQITGQILKALSQNREIEKDRLQSVGHHLPYWTVKKVLNQATKNSLRDNRYILTGFLSDLGQIDLETFSTSNFQAVDAYHLPARTHLMPFSVNICHHNNGTRLGLAFLKDIDSQPIMNSLQEFIESRSAPPSK
jgi:hypothetical protein